MPYRFTHVNMSDQSVSVNENLSFEFSGEIKPTNLITHFSILLWKILKFLILIWFILLLKITSCFHDEYVIICTSVNCSFVEDEISVLSPMCRISTIEGVWAKRKLSPFFKKKHTWPYLIQEHLLLLFHWFIPILSFQGCTGG